MERRGFIIFLGIMFFFLFISTFNQDFEYHITGAAEITSKNDQDIEDEFYNEKDGFDVSIPDEELLAQKEQAYTERVNFIGSGSKNSADYYRVLENGINIEYSPGDNKFLRVYSPSNEVLKDFEPLEDIKVIELEEDKVEIGVYEIQEIEKDRVLSRDYFFVTSPEGDLTKEEIEKMYNIKQEDIVKEYGLEEDISSYLLGKLANAEVIKNTLSSRDVGKFRCVLEFDKDQISILDSVDILSKTDDVYYSPFEGDDLVKTFVKKIDLDSSVKFSPNQKMLASFGIYFSDKLELGAEYSKINLLVVNEEPKIGLEF